jgi:hypothetical protein
MPAMIVNCITPSIADSAHLDVSESPVNFIRFRESGTGPHSPASSWAKNQHSACSLRPDAAALFKKHNRQ